MPEGPEIHYLADYLKKHLPRKLINIIARSKRKVHLPYNLTIKDIYAKGKIIIFDCTEYFVHLHMGLTGWITLEKPEYTKYIFEFSNNFKMYIDDSRKFSKVSVLSYKKHLKVLNNLGKDILTPEYTFSYFYENIKKYKKIIVAFLLDQQINAGLGNYIKNDSLYVAKINPKRLTSDLNDIEIKKLYNAIIYVAYSNYVTLLTEAKLKIKSKLTKLKLKVPYKFKVYEQQYDPLGNKIKYEIINGRNTYFVPQIQK